MKPSIVYTMNSAEKGLSFPAVQMLVPPTAADLPAQPQQPFDPPQATSQQQAGGGEGKELVHHYTRLFAAMQNFSIFFRDAVIVLNDESITGFGRKHTIWAKIPYRPIGKSALVKTF